MSFKTTLLPPLYPELVHHQGYNIACGELVGHSDMVVMLRRFSGNEIQATCGPERIGDLRHSRVRMNKVGRGLVYRASFRFEEGLRRI
jgi:hypothetical protein